MDMESVDKTSECVLDGSAAGETVCAASKITAAPFVLPQAAALAGAKRPRRNQTACIVEPRVSLARACKNKSFSQARVQNKSSDADEFSLKACLIKSLQPASACVGEEISADSRKDDNEEKKEDEDERVSARITRTIDAIFASPDAYFAARAMAYVEAESKTLIASCHDQMQRALALRLKNSQDVQKDAETKKETEHETEEETDATDADALEMWTQRVSAFLQQLEAKIEFLAQTESVRIDALLALERAQDDQGSNDMNSADMLQDYESLALKRVGAAFASEASALALLESNVDLVMPFFALKNIEETFYKVCSADLELLLGVENKQREQHVRAEAFDVVSALCFKGAAAVEALTDPSTSPFALFHAPLQMQFSPAEFPQAQCFALCAFRYALDISDMPSSLYETHGDLCKTPSVLYETHGAAAACEETVASESTRIADSVTEKRAKRRAMVNQHAERCIRSVLAAMDTWLRQFFAAQFGGVGHLNSTHQWLKVWEESAKKQKRTTKAQRQQRQQSDDASSECVPVDARLFFVNLLHRAVATKNLDVLHVFLAPGSALREHFSVLWDCWKWDSEPIQVYFAICIQHAQPKSLATLLELADDACHSVHGLTLQNTWKLNASPVDLSPEVVDAFLAHPRLAPLALCAEVSLVQSKAGALEYMRLLEVVAAAKDGQGESEAFLRKSVFRSAWFIAVRVYFTTPLLLHYLIRKSEQGAEVSARRECSFAKAFYAHADAALAALKDAVRLGPFDAKAFLLEFMLSDVLLRDGSKRMQMLKDALAIIPVAPEDVSGVVLYFFENVFYCPASEYKALLEMLEFFLRQPCVTPAQAKILYDHARDLPCRMTIAAEKKIFEKILLYVKRRADTVSA